ASVLTPRPQACTARTLHPTAVRGRQDLADRRSRRGGCRGCGAGQPGAAYRQGLRPDRSAVADDGRDRTGVQRRAGPHHSLCRRTAADLGSQAPGKSHAGACDRTPHHQGPADSRQPLRPNARPLPAAGRSRADLRRRIRSPERGRVHARLKLLSNERMIIMPSVSTTPEPRPHVGPRTLSQESSSSSSARKNRPAMPPMTGYQRFVVALLAFLQFTVILDFMTLSPLGATLMPALRLTPAQFGFVVSVYAFSASASGLLAAGFADRFDRKRFLLFFYGGFILGTL